MAQHDFDVVDRCIQMIAQDGLDILHSSDSVTEDMTEFEHRLDVLRAKISGEVDTQALHTASDLSSSSTLGTSYNRPQICLNDAADDSEVPDLKQKLAVLATGIQLLSDRIQQKTQQLASRSEDFAVCETGTSTNDGNTNATTPASMSSTMAGTNQAENTDQIASNLRETVGTNLYRDHLVRLQESHMDLKCRMVILEAENKRLAEEATLQRKEAEHRKLQLEVLQKAGSNLSNHLDTPRRYGGASSVPTPSSGSSTPQRPQRRQQKQSDKSTPPVPRQTLPSRPLRQKSPAKDATSTSTGQLPSASRGSVSTGRHTTRALLVRRPHVDGTESVPLPRGNLTPRVPASGNVVCRIRAPQKEATDMSELDGSSRSTGSKTADVSPLRSRPKGVAAPQWRSRSLTPPLSTSPGRDKQKELPPRWESLAGTAYCEETGRPIVDRVILSDYTFANGRNAECIFWVNARVRWADLLITEAGRVPHRGEDLVLFVLHGTTQREASTPPSLQAARIWRVGSTRVIRHLPFEDRGNLPIVADVGGALLHYALQHLEPQTSTAQIWPRQSVKVETAGAIVTRMISRQSSPRASSPQPLRVVARSFSSERGETRPGASMPHQFGSALSLSNRLTIHM